MDKITNIIRTLSFVNNNCFTTIISAKSKTRVTDVSRDRPARTIAPRSQNELSGDGRPNGSVATISHSLSIAVPAKVYKQNRNIYCVLILLFHRIIKIVCVCVCVYCLINKIKTSITM